MSKVFRNHEKYRYQQDFRINIGYRSTMRKTDGGKDYNKFPWKLQETSQGGDEDENNIRTKSLK
jgi:hypothetical protein